MSRDDPRWMPGAGRNQRAHQPGVLGACVARAPSCQNAIATANMQNGPAAAIASGFFSPTRDIKRRAAPAIVFQRRQSRPRYPKRSTFQFIGRIAGIGEKRRHRIRTTKRSAHIRANRHEQRAAKNSPSFLLAETLIAVTTHATWSPPCDTGRFRTIGA